jgi:hypothetical protein
MAEYIEVEEEQDLSQGNWIRTGVASEAVVILADNSVISVDSDTEFELVDIPDSRDGSTSIKQYVGNLWHRVGGLAGKDTYEVETLNSIAAVRGTIFSSGINGDLDEFVGLESSVDISNLNDSNINETLGEQEFISSSSSEIVFSAIPERILSSEWYIKNRILDEKFLDAISKGTQLREIVREQKTVSEKNSGAESLLPFGEIYQDSEQTCTDIKSVNIEELKQSYQLASVFYDFGFSLDQIVGLYNDLKTACQDGFITVDEATVIQSRYSFIAN